MAVPLEALQALLVEMTRMNNENMTNLVTMFQTKKSEGMTDTRGIGRPTSFRGDEAKYAEWKAKLMAYLRVAAPKSDEWTNWACSQTSPITEDDVDMTYTNDDDNRMVKEWAVKVYAILLSCTEDDAFRICHSVKDGNGLEAMRLLMKRFEPRTPGTKRALLKAVINNGSSKRPDEIEKNLMHVEELMKRYEVLAGSELPEDLRVTVIIDLCTKDLKEHLELMTREMKYKEVRDEIMSYVERKRDLFGSQLKAMEVDNYEETSPTWWGGQDPWNDEAQYNDELYYFQPSYNKGKGKGNYGKGNYKGDYGKGNHKGDGKNSYKGYGKAKGEKGDGKGKGGGFQGNCHWCGEWGHSQSRCRKKDEYMDGIRKGKGNEGGYRSADNVEEHECSEHDKPQQGLEHLESKGGYRTLCSLEHRTVAAIRPTGKANTFAALTPDDDEDDDMNFEEQEMQGPPGLSWTKVEHRSPKKKKVWKKMDRREISSLEINTFDRTKNKQEQLKADKDLWITIDSGASENVINKQMAPQFRVQPSTGSNAGTTYITANGDEMANQGEKDVKIVTKEGHKCLLKMQVTDVRKPLMSVARICDAGHQVTFTNEGGNIKHLQTGQTTHFDRIDNVYRLKVDLAESSGFARQGM